MLFKLFIIFLLTQCRYSWAESNQSDVIYLLENIFKVQNFPSKILAYLCWSKGIFLFIQNFYSTILNILDLKIRLVKKLSENGHFVNIQKSNEQINYLNPQEHQSFLLDLECENSKNLLKQVCAKLNINAK